MPTLDEMARECVCLHTRMAARAVTRVFDAAIRSSGLEATQFTLLVALKRGTAGSTAALAEVLALERTTLVRNLRLLRERGLVEAVPGKRRAIVHRVTPAGEAAIEEAMPFWIEAQAASEAAIGHAAWIETRDRLRAIRRALRRPAAS